MLRGWLYPGAHSSLCTEYKRPEDVRAPAGCKEERDASCFAAGTRTGAVARTGADRDAATAQAAAAGLEVAIPDEISSANGAGAKCWCLDRASATGNAADCCHARGTTACCAFAQGRNGLVSTG